MSVLDNFKARAAAILSSIYANGQVVNHTLNTPAEIRLYIAQITQVQKSLRLLKAEVNNESKQVSMNYSDKMAHVSSHPLFGAFVGRKKASHLSALDRQRLHHNKNAALEPYRHAAMYLDEEIRIWENAKIEVKRLLMQQPG